MAEVLDESRLFIEYLHYSILREAQTEQVLLSILEHLRTVRDYGAFWLKVHSLSSTIFELCK
jgi:hypothetical protein